MTAAHQLIVGTYTERLPHVNGTAPGILGCTYSDGTTGTPTLLVRSRNPSWLVVTASGHNVYAVNETADFAGKATGGVTAYARDDRTGALSEINRSSSAGLAPAHLALHGEERRVLVANYESGSIASFSVDERGGLGALVGHCQHVGSSVDPARQTGPHAHMICVDPVTDRVLVPDLGLDVVLSYEVSETGEFVERVEERERGREELRAMERGYQLAGLRKGMGLTQAQVAAAMGVSQARVSQIEHGKITEVDAVRAYVEALGGVVDVVARVGDVTIKVA